MTLRTWGTVIALCVACSSTALAQTSGTPVSQGNPAGGANAWPVTVTDTSNVKVKPGDAVNNAVRVNCVTGCSGGGGGGGASKVDDSAFGIGTDAVAPAGGLADEVSPDSVDEGDTGLVRMSLNRNWYFQLRDGLGNERGASVSAANALKVDGSAVTQPVSGTVAATQSGGWSVTANAGTNLNTSALLLESTFGRSQGSATAGQTGPLIQGAVTTAAPSYTTAQTSPLSLTLSGLLRVDGSGVTQPVSGTVAATQSGSWSLAANQSVNVAQINGVTPLMGNGTTGTGSQRVTIASDNTAFTVNAAQSGTWTVQPGNTQNTTEWLTKPTPRTVSSANNTGTCTSVTTSSTTVLASNASRKAYGFKAPSTNTVAIFCKLGATATTAAVPFEAGASWSQDQGAVYTGVIDCITASSSSSICVYEFN